MSLAYGEQQRSNTALGSSGAGGHRELERQYHVVLQDSLGVPALGFREGTWFRLTVSGPQPLQLRGAIRTCPHAAGSIVQIACWWMRENPMQPRSLDLATELALTVGELVRVCPADGLGTTSMDLLPMAMAAVAQSGPPVTPAPALPSGSSAYSAAGSGFGSTPALGSSASGSGDAFGTGPAFGSTAASTYGSATSATSAASTSAYGQSSGYSTSSSGYGAADTTSSTVANGYGTSSSAYGSTTSAYGSTSTDTYSTADAYSTAGGPTNGYSSSSSGYGSTASSAGGYGSSGATTSTYGSASGSGYGSASYTIDESDPLGQGPYSAVTGQLGQSTYSSDPLGQSSYATSSDPLAQSSYSAGAYPSSSTYETSYLPKTTAATPAESGWFEPADGTGTGGFPAVPPAPVMGRPAPRPPAPAPTQKPYSGASSAGSGRGYNSGAPQQAALPPAGRGRETTGNADWEPRSAAPRRPGTGNSHQPRPQQQAAGPRPVPGAAAGQPQPPRPRPQQPRDGYGRPAEPQDPGRSSDRNGVPPRRPAPNQQPQRGTMGRRPASRPGRPSER